MKVTIYKYSNGAWEEKKEYKTRKEFISEMKETDKESLKEDYNIKNFIDACDYYADRNGNIKIISGIDKITFTHGKIYNNNAYIRNCK